MLCEVVDNGSGVPEEEVKPLYLDNTHLSNSSVGGSNSARMRLALVRKIALLHDGQIGMRNNTEGGATF